MKRLFFVTAIVLYSYASAAQVKEENSLLWEISGNGLKTPSYLFGTIHMICKEDYFMADVVKQKFNASTKIFLELDMDDPGMQMKLMQLARLPQGETLKTIFGADYNMVDSFFKRNSQFPLSIFNQFKPMMVMSMLYLTMMPCKATESYEQNFITMAKANGKDVQGLETMEDQMAVFDGIPDTLEVKNIVKLIKEFEQQKKQFADMVQVYKEQNLTKLMQSIEGSPDLMNAEEELLTKRNNNWIPVMQKNTKEAASFFAVGAAHLAGKNGIITLLRKAGYTVTSLK